MKRSVMEAVLYIERGINMLEEIRERHKLYYMDGEESHYVDDIQYCLSLIDRYEGENRILREERDSAQRVSMASLEQVVSSGTVLLHQREVAESIKKFERIKEEHKWYKEALEEIAYSGPVEDFRDIARSALEDK